MLGSKSPIEIAIQSENQAQILLAISAAREKGQKSAL